MARSRHGHRVEGSGGGAGLPSWAQRHLGEAGEAVTVAVPSPSRHHRRAAAPESSHRLRGWGVAIVSVAAAVGAVPLAISSVAADRSDDPLPTVDTFTAGAPGPLESGDAPRGGGTRTVPAPSSDDPATAGILEAPAAAARAPAAPGPALPGRTVPVPQPAAVVKPTVPAASSTTTAPARPLAGTPTTAPTTTAGDDDGGGRAAPQPTTPVTPPASSSGSGGSGGSGGGNDSPGLVGGLVNTTDKVVGGAGRTLGGLL